MWKFIQYVLKFWHRERVLVSEPPLDLDLRQGLDWLLLQADAISAASNFYWVSEQEIRAIKKSQISGKYEPHQSFFSDVLVRSYRPFKRDELFSLVCKLEESRLTTYTIDNSVCVPVYHPDKHTSYGCLVAANVPAEKLLEAQKNLSQLAAAASRYLSYCFQYFEASSMSLKDDLTSLFNQKYLSMVLEAEVHRSSRTNSKFSVLFIDIDHFKRVNDSLGHWVGSHLLVELGTMLSSGIRKSDYAFRYGGDEFVVLLPATNSEGAKVAAERIRSKVEGRAFCVDGKSINITLSIGIATFPDHAKSHQDIIKMADEAMYNGKNKSRNIVLLAG